MESHTCMDDFGRAAPLDHAPEAVKRFAGQVRKSLPFVVDGGGPMPDWKDVVGEAFSPRDGVRTIETPSSRLGRHDLADRVRCARIALEFDLAMEGRAAVRVSYDSLFGDLVHCTEHRSALSMLAVEVTSFVPERNVPLYPLQVVVRSARYAACCNRSDRFDGREWSDPAHTKYAAETPDRDQSSVVACRRLVSLRDRLPLLVFQADEAQTTEEHITLQSALVDGAAAPFAAKGNVYELPAPGRGLSSDYRLVTEIIRNPTTAAPNAPNLTVETSNAGEHIIIPVETVQRFCRQLRDAHVHEGRCTVVPRADIIVELVPPHESSLMAEAVALCRAKKVPLDVVVELVFWVVVWGEPPYAEAKPPADL